MNTIVEELLAAQIQTLEARLAIAVAALEQYANESFWGMKRGLIGHAESPHTVWIGARYNGYTVAQDALDAIARIGGRQNVPPTGRERETLDAIQSATRVIFGAEWDLSGVDGAQQSAEADIDAGENE